MQDFVLNNENKQTDELTMTVSPICVSDGKKVAYVSFSDSDRNAEGVIPECIIKSCNGFSNEEKEALETYMRTNLTMLKKMAANIDILGAMMSENHRI